MILHVVCIHVVVCPWFCSFCFRGIHMLPNHQIAITWSKEPGKHATLQPVFFNIISWSMGSGYVGNPFAWNILECPNVFSMGWILGLGEFLAHPWWRRRGPTPMCKGAMLLYLGLASNFKTNPSIYSHIDIVDGRKIGFAPAVTCNYVKSWKKQFEIFSILNWLAGFLPSTVSIP